MIRNRYIESQANKWRQSSGLTPADEELGERIYTSRLIGQDPDLVMHGGGNTSVKVERTNIFGQTQRVIHIKGSGSDLDTIDADGLPGLWLDPLLKLRQLATLSDEQMVNIQRSNLLDYRAPNPSVETLLHAFLPFKYVDHTHATAFLVLADIPGAEGVCREVFGDRLGIVPYIMPGFALAKKAAEVFEENSNVEGLLLLKHGHFSFGDTARQSYERIVEQTNEIAEHFGMTSGTNYRERRDCSHLPVLPALRSAVARHTGVAEARMPVLDIRNGEDVHDFLKREDLAELAQCGTASPDHVIRIKGRPLVLPKSVWSRGNGAIDEAVGQFAGEYRRYFDRQHAESKETKRPLTPEPKLAWIEEIGLVGIGENAKAASVAADLGVQNILVRAVAKENGGFQPINEKESFEVEHWSLEQAKLGRQAPLRFQGHVVLVTGGAGTIGLETAKAFARLGANCLIVDYDDSKLKEAMNQLGQGHASAALDLTQPGAATEAMNAAILNFGGIDIVVSNVGIAASGAMLEMEESEFRNGFELNFFINRGIAVEAAKVMRAQSRGGQILFSISKQAVNPGKNFGAYGIPKAATMSLLRHLALELGQDRIRVNGINADRIRSGLLNDEVISDRASARGISEEEYMRGNLLGQEVEAAHVADAFVALASCERTSAHVLTVDGGKIEAALR